MTLELRKVTGPCIGDTCPALYETDRDTYVVQGYKVTDDVSFTIPDGETIVEIPKDLLSELLTR